MTPMTRYLIGALVGLVAVTMGIGLWQARRAVHAWRQAEAGIMARAQRTASAWRDEPEPDEPVPWPDEVYLRLSVITCTRCKPVPDGICTCGIDCGHRACMFDHAVLTGLNRDELAFLRGERGMPEKRDAL